MTAVLAPRRAATPTVADLHLAAGAIVAQGWPIGPRPMPCVCGLPRWDHEVPSRPGCGAYTHDPADALACLACEVVDRDVMDDVVAAAADRHVPSGNSGPRVSDVGACRRSVWYRESPPDGFVADPRMYDRQAVLGHLIHDAAAAARQPRYPWRLYEFEVAVPGLDKLGRVDEYDPVLAEVVDTKSAGARKWDRVGEDGPDESAWAQAMIYGLALDDAGLPVNTVCIVVVHRDTGEEERFRRRYDPAVARAWLDDLVGLATMLDLGAVPPRDGSGPTTDWQCRGCFARSHCWNVADASDAGRSPESWTLLGAEPPDESVVWAGERHLAAAKTAAATKALADQAKALVQGIEGTYGDLVFKAVRRPMPEYKESFLRVVELYGLPEAYRPPVGEVAHPVRRIDRYTSVSRVRAAKRQKPVPGAGTKAGAS